MKTPNPKKASHSGEGNGETLNGDNPVPSITKEHIEAIEEIYATSYCSNENFLEKASEAIDILKHGVETNKVEPKCDNCGAQLVGFKSNKWCNNC